MKQMLQDNHVVNPDNFAAWLLKVVSVIDLTTLAGDDTKTNVTRLCVKVTKYYTFFITILFKIIVIVIILIFTGISTFVTKDLFKFRI